MILSPNNEGMSMLDCLCDLMGEHQQGHRTLWTDPGEVTEDSGSLSGLRNTSNKRHEEILVQVRLGDLVLQG